MTLEGVCRAYALGNRTIVWYGGVTFFGRNRKAVMRSLPYGASKLIVSLR